MKQQIIFFINFLIILLTSTPSTIISLERDYSYVAGWLSDDLDYDEDEDGSHIYYYNSDALCYNCIKSACYRYFPSNFENEIETEIIPSIKKDPFFDYDCITCRDPRIYSGYIHFQYKGDFPFLKRQIAYSKKYPKFQAYWPETSYKAEKISDIAVVLFEELIDSTALKKIRNLKWITKKNFLTQSWYFNNFRSLIGISLSACCFRFTDFYQVCKDIVQFSKEKFSINERNLIEDKTNAILDRLCGMFLEIYEESLELHPTDEIKNEIAFIELLYGVEKNKIKRRGISLNKINFSSKNDSNFQKKDLTSTITDKVTECTNSLPDWLIDEFWLYEGIRCNDLFLHREAIHFLSAVIEKNPLNIEAYQERLYAYFELGNLELAIEDYNSLKKCSLVKKELQSDDHYFKNYYNNNYQYLINDNVSRGTIDYSTGFCIGLTKGCGVSLIEIVPSTLSCCSGILHGLWSRQSNNFSVKSEIFLS